MEGEVVAMTVGVAERAIVLLVGGGILSLTVGVAERSTVEVGVAEGVACSVCFVHA